MSGTTGNELTVKNALANPESIDWSHRTVEGTEQLFNGLIDAAKNGHWIEAINVYFAIAESGNMNLFTGTRIVDIWQAEYMRDEDGNWLPRNVIKSMSDTYLHYFGDLLRARTVSRKIKQGPDA